MFKKEKLLNQCPFGMKDHQACSFYRKGVRIMEGGAPGKEEHIPFEECAINIIADCLENMVGRQIGLQQEMNLVRNEAAATNAIFSELFKLQKDRLISG